MRESDSLKVLSGLREPLVRGDREWLTRRPADKDAIKSFLGSPNDRSKLLGKSTDVRHIAALRRRAYDCPVWPVKSKSVAEDLVMLDQSNMIETCCFKSQVCPPGARKETHYRNVILFMRKIVEPVVPDLFNEKRIVSGVDQVIVSHAAAR